MVLSRSYFVYNSFKLFSITYHSLDIFLAYTMFKDEATKKDSYSYLFTK